MKEKIYLLISASVAVFCIHQSFSDSELNYDEIGHSSRHSSVGAALDIDPAVKALISSKTLPQGKELEEAPLATVKKGLDFIIHDKNSNAARLAGFTAEEVKGMAEIARASYTGHAHQEDMIHTMEQEGYTVKAFHKNTDETETGFAKGRHSGFVFMKGNEIIVSYRGTESNTLSNAFSDLSTDGNGAMQKNPHGAGRIHKGFEKELNRSHTYLLSIIRQHCQANNLDYKDLTFRVTGHSLGAGMATLFVDHLMNNLHVNPESISLITFASPRVGNKEFADAFTAKMKGRVLRVNVANDIVTGICPVSAGYTHVGESLDLRTNNGLLSAVTFVEHFMDTYIGSLKVLTPDNFKVREETNSQTAVSYTDYALGLALQALQTVDFTSWDFWTHYEGHEADFAESKIARKEAAKLLEPRLKDLHMVNLELADAIKRGEEKDMINILKMQQVKGIVAVIQLMQNLEKDEFVMKSLTKQQKLIASKIKSIFEVFEKQVQKVMEKVQAVDQLVLAAEESLKDLDGLKAFQTQAPADQNVSLKEAIERAAKTHAKNQELLEKARTSLEKTIAKLDVSKEILIKNISAIAKK